MKKPHIRRYDGTWGVYPNGCYPSLLYHAAKFAERLNDNGRIHESVAYFYIHIKVIDPNVDVEVGNEFASILHAVGWHEISKMEYAYCVTVFSTPNEHGVAMKIIGGGA